MLIKDQGIVLSVMNLQEDLCIIRIFGRDIGICSGAMRRKDLKFQAGDHVDFELKSRLEEHLGKLSVEVLTGYSVKMMYDKRKLVAFLSITEQILQLFTSHDPHANMYDSLFEYLSFHHKSHGFNWKKFLDIERDILAYSGYGLELSRCAVSGNCDDLLYISPNSGKAVARDVGEPYKHKLFALPQIFTQNIDYNQYFASTNMDTNMIKDISSAIQIIHFFLHKHIDNPSKNLQYTQMIQSMV